MKTRRIRGKLVWWAVLIVVVAGLFVPAAMGHATDDSQWETFQRCFNSSQNG
jgi:hypothetical protein